MVNEEMYQLGAEPNAIRAVFSYGLARKAEIGEDKVYDFSLGNPTIPSPNKVKETILELLEKPSDDIHGYTPAQGDPNTRKAIASSINRRYGMSATADLIYMTTGAASALFIIIKAISHPDDEIIVISPYFPEYKVWIEQSQCRCVEVPANPSNFRLDVEAIEKAITSRTVGVIVNSPNNPVGVVYPKENICELANLLEKKQIEHGHGIYLLCDEPYREVVYNGLEVPFIPCLYDNTIVAYSYSKALSLPGERIGYAYVSERIGNAAEIYTAVCGAGRALGYVCAPSLMQHVIEKCVDEPTDIAAYEENRKLLTSMLSRLGYKYIEPEGAFYLWMKALEDDAEAFNERAKAHEILLVTSTSFGCEGWVRIGYCVDKEMIKSSEPAFAALMNEYR